jgi:hypothetical protein
MYVLLRQVISLLLFSLNCNCTDGVYGILQMILKPICAVLAIFMQLLGIYGEGKFGWKYG